MFRIATLILFFCGLPQLSFAASLYLDPPFDDLYRSDAVITAVRLDVDRSAGECVNAFDITIRYTDVLLPVDISLGRSIVPLWVEIPTINTDTKTITMAGGIPNGYCGRIDGDTNLTNVLAEIVFRLPGTSEIESGTSIISFDPSTTAYLNDGFGTVAPLRTFQAEYRLYDEVGETIRDDWTTSIIDDRLPPEAFEITLQPGNIETNGKYFIEFNTTDKQTGLSHYEIMEERDIKNSFFTFGGVNAPWVRERSPYILKDQSLRSIIRVKAVDKAGNEYIATLLPNNSGLNTVERIIVGVALFGVVMIIGMLIWHFYRRRNKVETFDQNYNH